MRDRGSPVPFVFAGLALSALLAGPAEAADCTAADGPELTSCLAQLGPGDTLSLEAGEFAVNNLSVNGLVASPDAPITIRGALGPNGERLSHIIGQSGNSNVVDIQSSAHLIFADFELSFVGGKQGNGVDLIKFGGMGEASHHIDFVNLDLHDCGNVALSSQAREIHHIRVLASHIHDIGGSCFYWGYYEDENPLRWAHDSEIRGNLLQRCPADPSSETHYGIQLKSGNHDNLIADNVLVDIGGTSRAGIIVYHSAPKPVGEPLAGSNTVIANLLVRPRNEGINAAAGARILNNIVVDAGGIAIFLQPRSYGGATYYGSLEVAHNSVVQTLGDATAHGIRWTAADWSLADDARPSSFVANLALVSNGADGLRPPSAEALVDQNATDANDNGAANTVTLMDPASALQSLSFGEAGYLVPAEAGPLDGAAPVTAVTDDYAGQARDPASPDIGAYEWAGALPPALDEDAPKPEGGDTGDGDTGTTGDGDTGDTGTTGDGDGDTGTTGTTGGESGSEGGLDEVGDSGDTGNLGGADEAEGCACATGSPAPQGLGLGLLALGLFARRRRALTRRARSR